MEVGEIAVAVTRVSAISRIHTLGAHHSRRFCLSGMRDNKQSKYGGGGGYLT
jgi:hypothetical protein